MARQLPQVDPWKAAVAILLILLAASLAAVLPGEPVIPEVEATKPEVVDHTEYFEEAGIEEYNGSATCIQCHMDEVVEVFHSYHYQMASVLEDVAGRQAVLFGGKYAYNDYCGSIFWQGTVPVNYIGKAVLKAPPPGYEDKAGTLIATGCSMCHGVSMGLPPSPEPTPEQLANIDCLACHASPEVYVSGPKAVKSGVKEVYQDENGVWHYRVNLDAQTVARSIIDKPASENCLACHAFSGGGPGYKRPNLSPDLYNPSEEFDVHMAAGMGCIDCHKGSDHAFPTTSADTWSREPGEAPGCEGCHTGDPHAGLEGWFLNRFHDRVACQTCHIPVIASGSYPTDVYRDWSESEFLAKAGKYEPLIELEGNVSPVYAWYNGTRQVYLYPEKVSPTGDGEIIYVAPLGSRDDPDSKIYPFKLHKTRVPYSSVNETLVPVKVGIVFATGNNTKAVLAGAQTAGLVWDGEWVTLVRYMQVNHGVKPADEALWCLDCHGPTVRRMPWHELGYGHWPEIAFTLATIAVILVVGVAAWKLVGRLR